MAEAEAIDYCVSFMVRFHGRKETVLASLPLLPSVARESQALNITPACNS